MLKFNHHRRHRRVASGPILALFRQGILDIGKACQCWEGSFPVPHSSSLSTRDPREGFSERPSRVGRPS